MLSSLSIIIPVLDEQDVIGELLRTLQPLRFAGHEVIVVDGGSQDNTCQQALPLCDHLIRTQPGRARQMNQGASQAQGDVILFLHADTQLPADAADLILQGLCETGRQWGRFDLRLTGTEFSFSIIAWCMNRRSRLTGIATGDQAIFVRRDVFQQYQGYADLALMEDIELSSRLKKASAPLCLSAPVISSSRRWEQHGILATVLKMWSLRLAFFFGASSESLAQRYRG